MHIGALIDDIKQFKLLFDKHLLSFIQQKQSLFDQTTSSGVIQQSIGHVSHIARAGGKRIRPYLAYLSYQMCSGQDYKAIMPALVGIELFHIFALIHDDIIDESNERHGVKTLHSYISDIYPQAKRPQQIGYAQAMLIGDLVFAWSQEALLSNTPPRSLAHVQQLYYNMIQEIVVGQMMDINLTCTTTSSLQDIEEKNRLKTARYTFVSPLQIGAALATDTHTYNSFFQTFGEVLGSAYQLQDDYIDITGDPQITGKDNLRDLQEAQHTFFTQYIFDFGTPQQQQKLKSLLGQPLTPAQRIEAIELFNSSGSLQAGLQLIGTKIAQARQALVDFQVPQAFLPAFQALVQLIQTRTS